MCVCHISPLERPFVLKLLSRTHQATEVKKYVGFSLKPLPSKVMALFAHLRHRYCSGILRNFSTATIVNATWNTTQCKTASFFLFSLRLLFTNLQYTFRYTHFSIACAFQDSRTRGTEGSALSFYYCFQASCVVLLCLSVVLLCLSVVLLLCCLAFLSISELSCTCTSQLPPLPLV